MARIDKYMNQAENYYLRKKEDLERRMNYEMNLESDWTKISTTLTNGTPNYAPLIATLCIVLGLTTAAQRLEFRVRTMTLFNSYDPEFIYQRLIEIGYKVKEEFPDE